MTDSFSLSLYQAQLMAAAQQLSRLNEVSERYGLTLTDAEIHTLAKAHLETLQTAGRLELGESLLPRLTYAFCDSPYINRSEYLDTLLALQELFYTLKNECNDALTDEELIEALRKVFNHRAHGSLSYLENLTVSDLYRALNGSLDDREDEEAFDDTDF
ncbi:MAG TPA: DUF6323 family protein [Candidatus Limiplasma sp.]|nr:DUF6323 family protein [Candidatus Limiplasma sp.]HPS81262.1 DUF6323 family protein [Candidatus Limiplasma sp.]